MRPKSDENSILLIRAIPRHIYHSIVCIGALVARREDDHYAVEALEAPHVGERTEKELIGAFVGKIGELSPQLVTFNGSERTEKELISAFVVPVTCPLFEEGLFN